MAEQQATTEQQAEVAEEQQHTPPPKGKRTRKAKADNNGSKTRKKAALTQPPPPQSDPVAASIMEQQQQIPLELLQQQQLQAQQQEGVVDPSQLLQLQHGQLAPMVHAGGMMDEQSAMAWAQAQQQQQQMAGMATVEQGVVVPGMGVVDPTQQMLIGGTIPPPQPLQGMESYGSTLGDGSFDDQMNKPRRKSSKKATKDLSEDGLAQRRLKNRKSASVSRRRKKEYINNLEQTNTCLTTERLELQLKVATLTNHTWELQLKVEELEKQLVDARAERNELAKQRDQLGLPHLQAPVDIAAGGNEAGGAGVPNNMIMMAEAQQQQVVQQQQAEAQQQPIYQ